MIKLIALYRKPEDEAAFMAHYDTVHRPLVEAVPGLAAIRVSRMVGAPTGGDAPYFLMAEMAFADRATFDAAMASPENRAAGKDLISFAKGIVTLMIAEGD